MYVWMLYMTLYFDPHISAGKLVDPILYPIKQNLCLQYLPVSLIIQPFELGCFLYDLKVAGHRVKFHNLTGVHASN